MCSLSTIVVTPALGNTLGDAVTAVTNNIRSLSIFAHSCFSVIKLFASLLFEQVQRFSDLKGSVPCSPVRVFPEPLFPGFYTHRHLLYVPRYICSPVPIFPGTYVPRYLYSPVPMFPGTYVPRYLCSPVPTFPGSHLPLFFVISIVLHSILNLTNVIIEVLIAC